MHFIFCPCICGLYDIDLWQRNATTPYLACFNLRTFFSFPYSNITLNKLKMRFTWIFLNSHPTSLKPLKLCCLRTLQWTNGRSKHPCRHANANFNSLCNYNRLLILSLQIICKCKWNKLPMDCMRFLFPKEFVTIIGLGYNTPCKADPTTYFVTVVYPGNQISTATPKPKSTK